MTSATPLRAALLMLLCLLGAAPIPVRAEPTPVTTTLIGDLARPLAFDAPAEAMALQKSDISAPLPGSIQAVPVAVGDRVEAGALLVVLDDWEYRAKAAQARADLLEIQARLDLAQRQLQRARQLKRKGQASEELLDRRETELASLTALAGRQQTLIQEAETRGAKCRITAPFPGVVVEKQAQPGAWAAPGMPLITLINPAAVELATQIPPRLGESLAQGARLTFVHPGGRHAVTLRTFLPAMDETSRTREARLDFSAAPPPPGAAGRLVWESPRPYLPATLPERRNGVLGVFLAEEGHARFHPLPEAQEGRPAELPEGVSGLAIVDGRAGLAPGAAITIVPVASPSPATDAP